MRLAQTNGIRPDRNYVRRRLFELGLTMLEERRHQADMLQTIKIVRGFDKVNSATWFQNVDASIKTVL
jgi:hypothetical protein